MWALRLCKKLTCMTRLVTFGVVQRQCKLREWLDETRLCSFINQLVGQQVWSLTYWWASRSNQSRQACRSLASVTAFLATWTSLARKASHTRVTLLSIPSSQTRWSDDTLRALCALVDNRAGEWQYNEYANKGWGMPAMWRSLKSPS